MSFIVCAASAMAVAILFYYWRFYHQKIVQQQLRERVAYMLWVMADAAPDMP